MIKGGRVSVDGRVSLSSSEKIDADSQSVHIDNTSLSYSKFHYLMMNKPQGFVSATQDRHERTVMELLDEKYAKLGLFPAGRLDKDAEGFLLLTNDGGFAHQITSPKSTIYKRYFIQFENDITEQDIQIFKQGIVLGDGLHCLPALLEPAADGAYVTVCEGKYHQVKRMMAAIGKPVLYLKRAQIGGLKLDENLRPGQFRALDNCEKRAILDTKVTKL